MTPQRKMQMQSQLLYFVKWYRPGMYYEAVAHDGRVIKLTFFIYMDNSDTPARQKVLNWKAWNAKLVFITVCAIYIYTQICLTVC